MDSSNNYINNSIISLEENNSNTQNKSKKRKKHNPETSNTSSDSFLSKFFNSVSKIGQGLKNIMSMKINIEEDNDYNSNLYDQICNRFNNQEEISLIEAPSFMDDSISYKKFIKKKEKRMRDNKDNDNINESNKMIISQNETKIINDINNNTLKELDSIENSSLEKQKGIFNHSLLKTKDQKINIKSTLLAKKRDREENSIINEIIREEEEKNENEDKDEKDDKKKKHQNNEKSIIKNSESKSRIDISSNNISEQKKRNNTSITSLSMKSLDSIKSEIEERRLKNLRSIEEMHKRHGLYYDYVKERQMREKILNEYYKEKEKRAAEDKIKMELEKKKREEEIEKLKIKKSSNFKISSLKRPKKTFSEEKNTQFQFTGKSENIISNQGINASNNLNVTFGNLSNNSAEDNNNKSLFNNNDNNKKEAKPLFGNNNNDNNKKDFKSLFGNNENNNNKNETKPLFGISASDNINKENKPLFGASNGLFGEKKSENKNENENKINFNNKTTSIFNNLINKNNDNPQEKKDENKQNAPLFSGTGGGLFSGSSIPSNTAPSNSLFNFNSNGNSNNTTNTEKNGGGLFNFGKGDKSTIFGTKKNIEESSSFFGINPSQQNNQKVNNMTIQKDELFNQETSVSKSINSNSLFVSNMPGNNGQNKNDSLVTNDNPFLKSLNQGNQSNKPVQSLFGNSGNVGGSLFGNGSGNRGLFGN